MPATTYDDFLRASSPRLAVVGPGMLSATSAYDLPVPTTVIPSGNRMTSVFPCTEDSVASTNRCTLSAADFVPRGRRSHLRWSARLLAPEMASDPVVLR